MDEEDGDFSLSTAARSRLSSLFQGVPNPGGDVNQALTFTAPKQPRKNENSQSSSETFKLLTATVVHAYKLKDGSYANQGKLGCAILGLHENSSYKFLLYKGKQIQVTACSIVPSFNFHVQPNNYVNFFDEKNENWSINFESEAVLTEFAKQVALAKANSEGKSPSSLVVQDLVLGEGPSIGNGDTAEVRYSCWSLANFSFGQLIDSNMKSELALRLRLGKSKIVKGLSDGLVGSQKGSMRLLIIPPNLIAEGATPSVPANTTVIFEILVVKVKVPRESSHSPSPIKAPEAMAEKKPELLPRPSISQEDNIRLRGASISEQLSQSPKKDKAQIISRMAKMGMATLPFQGAVAAHVSSESENEEEVPSDETPAHPTNSRTASPKSFAKPSSRKDSGSGLASQPVQMQAIQHQIVPDAAAYQVTQQSSQLSLPVQQAFVAPSPTMSFSTYQAAFPAQFPVHGMMPTSMADTHLPMLITETRSQNTEVRLSLSKITDKVDTVIQKVDELRLQQGRMPSISQAPFMESAVLVQNIERIVQENKQLKEDVEVKNAKMQTLNEKICDLFQRNQRFFEESSNMLEQRMQAESQAKLLSLEKEKAKLSSELLDTTSKLSLVSEELSKSRSLENQLKQRLRECEERQSADSDLEAGVNSLQQKLESANSMIENLTAQLSDLQSHNKILLESKSTLQKLLEESESKLEDIKIKTEKDLKESHNKEIREYQEKLKQLSEKGDSDADAGMGFLRKENEELRKEREELQSLVQELQKRLETSDACVESRDEKLRGLQSELEASLTWKKKYEVFYERTRAMKEKYEIQMSELIAEIKQLRAASPNFSGEIRKVMNVLFKMLQGQFDQKSSYEGSKVLEMALQSIRALTFQMLEMKSRASSSSSENDAESVKVVDNTAPSSKISAAEENKSLEPQKCHLENSVGSSEPLVQQNGLKESPDSNSSPFSRISGEENSSGQESIQNNSEPNSSGIPSKEDLKLNEVPVTPEAEELKIISKETIEVNRASPDIWRPQPPPLFDDDDEEDDDWLK